MLKNLGYSTSAGRWLTHRWGRSVWKLARPLRRAMCFDAAVPRLAVGAGGRSWEYREMERVGAAGAGERGERWSGDGLVTFGHRLAARGHMMPAGVVTELREGWLVGRHGAVVTVSGKLLLGAFRDSPRILGLEGNEELAGFLEGERWKGKGVAGKGVTAAEDWGKGRAVCSLVNRLDANYYHWVVEWCGQVEGLERYERETGERATVVIRKGGPRYLRESLEVLGVGGGDGDRIVEWDGDERGEGSRVERLVVGSRPGNGVACSPGSLAWLRRRFLDGAGVEEWGAGGRGERMLYVSRKQGGWRYVLNEGEVVERLTREGFEVVNGAGMSFAEQVRLFAQAKAIVGLHGAGLTNLLFAPRAAVVELFGEYGGGEYYSMSRGLGNGYATLRCRDEGGNVVVDVERLLKVLRAAMPKLAVRQHEGAI